MKPDHCFETAFQRIDAENAMDPNVVVIKGEEYPCELFFARRRTDWVHALSPRPTESLLLAARAQHLGRWEVPRGRYPAGLNGYLQWREDLKTFHAERAATILREAGYAPDFITSVAVLIRKERDPQDPESRVLEDTLCLVFLEYQLDEMIAKTDHEKIIGILQKTWQKMSPDGRDAARTLPLSTAGAHLLSEAGLL